MKLMTFNIQHGACFRDPKRRVDLSRTAALIEKYAPDIVSLNEVRGIGEKPLAPQIKTPLGKADGESITADFSDQTQILSSLTGMTGIFAPAITLSEGILYGNALLSRYPFENMKVTGIASPDKGEQYYKSIHAYESRCLLSAEIETSEGRVTVFTCHMGLNPDERISAVKTICREADGVSGGKILMGDFNMAPGCELLIPIKERFADCAAVLGAEKPTFPADRPAIKIDYIFVSRDMTVKSAEIPDEYVSDHRVHIADVQYN